MATDTPTTIEDTVFSMQPLLRNGLLKTLLQQQINMEQ
jgi:hypothetical protein